MIEILANSMGVVLDSGTRPVVLDRAQELGYPVTALDLMVEPLVFEPSSNLCAGTWSGL